MTENIKKHIELLGMKTKDKVTAFKGIVTAISFDLYGCVQAVITPEIDKDGNIPGGQWFDVNRLEILNSSPVMSVPDFLSDIIQSRGEQGAADKPLP